MQDVATEHSAAQGWPLERYVALGAGWFVRRHTVEYLRPAFAGDTLTLLTWVAAFERSSSPRRYLFFRAGRRAGRGAGRDAVGVRQVRDRRAAAHSRRVAQRVRRGTDAEALRAAGRDAGGRLSAAGRVAQLCFFAAARTCRRGARRERVEACLQCIRPARRASPRRRQRPRASTRRRRERRFVAHIRCDRRADACAGVFGKEQQMASGVGDALAGDRAERARERLLDEPRQRDRELLQRRDAARGRRRPPTSSSQRAGSARSAGTASGDTWSVASAPSRAPSVEASGRRRRSENDRGERRSSRGRTCVPHARRAARAPIARARGSDWRRRPGSAAGSSFGVCTMVPRENRGATASAARQ